MNDGQRSGWPFFNVGGWLVLLAMLWFAIFGENGYVELLKLHRFKQELEARVADVQKQNQELRDEIKALTDKDNKEVERIAREDLGMAKDGEVIYQFKVDKNNEKSDAKKDEVKK
jgi:cell division protein FtsB